jgi:hypothetical protein
MSIKCVFFKSQILPSDLCRTAPAANKALSLAPHKSSTYAAIGFTHHLMGQPQEAIEFYHRALGLKSNDTFLSKHCLRPVLFLGFIFLFFPYRNIKTTTNKIIF